jgi:anti-sigma regulatory factor (Ser/Thr protein kinase)
MAPGQGQARQEIVLPAEPTAVRQARAWLAETTADVLDAARRIDVELVLSEVVGNAVRHGGPGLAISVATTRGGGLLRVDVTDDGPGLAPRPNAMASDRYGGFGLFIVEQLTRRWGVTREDNRTRVWFELDFELAA